MDREPRRAGGSAPRRAPAGARAAPPRVPEQLPPAAPQSSTTCPGRSPLSGRGCVGSDSPRPTQGTSPQPLRGGRGGWRGHFRSPGTRRAGPAGGQDLGEGQTGSPNSSLPPRPGPTRARRANRSVLTPPWPWAERCGHSRLISGAGGPQEQPVTVFLAPSAGTLALPRTRPIPAAPPSSTGRAPQDPKAGCVSLQWPQGT